MCIVFKISFAYITGNNANWNKTKAMQYSKIKTTYWYLLNVSFVFLFATRIIIGMNGRIKMFIGKKEDETDPNIAS